MKSKVLIVILAVSAFTCGVCAIDNAWNGNVLAAIAFTAIAIVSAFTCGMYAQSYSSQ